MIAFVQTRGNRPVTCLEARTFVSEHRCLIQCDHLLLDLVI